MRRKVTQKMEAHSAPKMEAHSAPKMEAHSAPIRVPQTFFWQNKDKKNLGHPHVRVLPHHFINM